MQQFTTQDRRLIVVIVLALMLLVILVVPAYLLVFEQSGLKESVNHSYDLESALRHVQADLTDVLIAQGRYVITSDVAHLTRYKEALLRLPYDLHKVQLLMRNPLQQMRFRELDHAIQQDLAITATVIQAQTQHHGDIALAMVRQGDGKRVHDLVRRQISDLLATTHNLLINNQYNERNNAQRYIVLVSVGMLLSLLLIGLVIYRLWNEVIMRRRIEQELFTANSSLLEQIRVEAELNKQLEALSNSRLNRMTQLFAALSQCNQSIVRCTDEKALFAEICGHAVNFGGMTMAWIGLIDYERKLIKPVAQYGTGVEYLDGFEISLGRDRSTWNGPTSLAIRDNQPVWCMDFQNDPLTAAWHERAKRFGWGSSGALPLCRHGEPIGTFTVYSRTINFFDEASRKLLIEMAIDINFALDRFASEAARHQAELAVQSSNAHLQLIIDTEPDCVKIVGPYGKLVEMNKAGLAMVEAETLAEIQQYSLLDLITPEYKEAFMALHQRVMQGESGELVFEVTGLKGGRRCLETHAVPMRNTDGKITALLGISRDITAHKAADDRINYLANFDHLTGLPNRHKLDEKLDYALKLAKRSHGQLAILFIDIDHFKDINDTLGHHVGDTVLVAFSKRIKMVLREQDIVARLGGDEFVLMLPGNDASGAAQVAQKLLQMEASPYQDTTHDLSITASIGIALYPDDGTTIETLFKNADTALYRAKQEGRNAYRFFTPEMQANATHNAIVLGALRHALAHNQFEIYYQPQITLNGYRVIGVEALLRWQHPELGSVSPAEFIPIAENNGLILAIGEWVLRNAMNQLKQWRDQGQTDLVMTVNLSAIQLRHPNLIGMLENFMEAAGLPKSHLELELTESVAMHNAQDAIKIIKGLNDVGFGVSIDDFGTGYSSLSYLKRFKTYKLKIDQSFIRNITTNAEDRAIVTAIISMAKNLGLRTIAEGVETAEQLVYLREQDCDEVQGYYFSKPLTAVQFKEFMLNSCEVTAPSTNH